MVSFTKGLKGYEVVYYNGEYRLSAGNPQIFPTRKAAEVYKKNYKLSVPLYTYKTTPVISVNFLVSCLDNYIGYDVIDNNSDMIYTAYYDTSLCAENKVLEKVKRKLDEILEEMTEKNILKGDNEDAENC